MIMKIRGWYCKKCGNWVINYNNTGACFCWV